MFLGLRQPDSDNNVSCLGPCFNFPGTLVSCFFSEPEPALRGESYEVPWDPTQMVAGLHQSSAVLEFLVTDCVSSWFVREAWWTSVAGGRFEERQTTGFASVSCRPILGKSWGCHHEPRLLENPGGEARTASETQINTD